MTNFLFDFIRTMVNNQVDFVICGGIACVLQGCERTTFDLDLHLDMQVSNLSNFIRSAKSLSLIPRVPEPVDHLTNEEIRKKWISEKNALVYTMLSKDGPLQVDIFLNYPIPFELLKKDADMFNIDGYSFLVSSKEHLIEAKLMVQPLRQKDVEDIKILRELIHHENTAKTAH